MSTEKRHFLDEPRNVALLFRLLVGACAVLVAIDLVYHKHVHFGFEQWPGFYALFGFAAYAFIVFAGTWVRRVVMRGEDYYDRG
jgi:hypothetical protein